MSYLHPELPPIAITRGDTEKLSPHRRIFASAHSRRPRISSRARSTALR